MLYRPASVSHLVWPLILACFLQWPGSAGAAVSANDIRLALEATDVLPVEQRFLAGPAVHQFYENRGFQPVWTDNRRGLVAGALAALAGARRQGLDPAHYRYGLLAESFSGSREDDTALADVLLTDALLRLAADYLQGRLNPETLDWRWRSSTDMLALFEVLDSGLADGEVRAALERLLPQNPGYRGLVEALTEARQRREPIIPPIPSGRLIKPGDLDDRVPLLRKRLAGETVGDPKHYDPSLVAAVRAFQEQHSLASDGIVGPATLAALNLTAADIVRRITVNLERRRWLVRDPEDRYIVANPAGFWLEAHEDGRAVLRSRIVAGLPYRQTPVFSDLITYIVLNPRWIVPRSIAVRDKLPILRWDPDYLRRLNFKVYQRQGEEMREIDPDTIDWTAVTPNMFPYVLEQQPGPENALGHIKIIFPNRYNVYLHDTPSRDLFSKSSRAFSSGCIRVEQVFPLAGWLMRDEGLDEARLRERTASGREQTISLSTPVPVHIVYWTAWTGENGGLNLAVDVYNRDRRVADALEQPLNGY